MDPPTGIEDALDATLLADGETLIQTAGGTILSDDPASSIARGAAFGRYMILERLGAGAMGVVYTAYDPKLDRRIALKLLRIADGGGDPQTIARVIREAQALAKLSHPNVVTIHDCDICGEHVYLAMELVEGTTLSRWLRGGRRELAEILERFLAAGDGLAAAHHAGLVHRDFKPDNVLIGSDGQVKVADFGIARDADEDHLAGPSHFAERAADLASDDGEGSGERGGDNGDNGDNNDNNGPGSTARLTQTGAIVGTPAYMAPEQHVGIRVDGRCDQFAFCVALFEAIYGVHPFSSKTYLELRRRVLAGDLVAIPGRSDVPARVRAAILRGLDVYAERRFPTMEALLAELAFDPRRRRRRILAGLGFVGLLAITGGAIAYGVSQDRAACEGGERHFVGVWDPSARATAEEAFAATGRPFAAKAWESSAAALDRYRASWLAMHREACEATVVYHEQSAALLDLRMACLDRHFRRFAATAALFREADAELVLRAVSAVEALPPIDTCGDLEGLVARESPPDPATQAERERLEQLLAEASALEVAGRYDLSFARAELALSLARELDDRARARALHAKGSVVDQRGRSAMAAELLAEAGILAERAGDDLLRGKIWSQLGLIEGLAIDRSEEAERRLRHTAAILDRGGADRRHHAELESRLGAVLTARGRYDEAIATLERALTMIREAKDEPGALSLLELSTLNALGSAHDLRGEVSAAEGRYHEALAIARRSLGADHPESAKILNNLAILAKARGDHGAALTDYHRALEIRRRAYEPDHPETGATLCNLGNLYTAMGRYDQSIAYYREAIAIYERSLDPDSELLAQVHYNVGVSHQLSGDYAAAIASYRRSLAISEAIYPAEHPEVAYPLAGLGTALVAIGELEGAREPLERALAIRSREGVAPIDLGEIRFALARALPAEARGRARELARLALAEYEGDGNAESVGEIKRWLAANSRD